MFASDVDPEAIATAREGYYALDSPGISAERLARHFVKDETGYRVQKALRAKQYHSVKLYRQPYNQR